MDITLTLLLVLALGAIAGFEVGRRFPNRRGLMRALSRMDAADLTVLVASLEHRWGVSKAPQAIMLAANKDPASAKLVDEADDD